MENCKKKVFFSNKYHEGRRRAFDRELCRKVRGEFWMLPKLEESKVEMPILFSKRKKVEKMRNSRKLWQKCYPIPSHPKCCTKSSIPKHIPNFQLKFLVRNITKQKKNHIVRKFSSILHPEHKYFHGKLHFRTYFFLFYFTWKIVRFLHTIFLYFIFFCVLVKC